MKVEEWEQLTVQARLVVTLLGVVHVALGLAVFVGGAVRFPPPTYQPLLVLTGGHVWPYAAAFFVAGGLMLLHRTLNIVIAGLVLGWLICNLWAALFLYAVFQFPDAGATATVAYGGYALLDAIFAVKVWLYRRRIKARLGK